MNGPLAMRIFESDLDPHLKPVAVLLALFGDAHGSNIYPSVARCAYLLSVEPRTVERQLAKLRALGILEPESSTSGGRSRTVHYRFCVDHLPGRSPFEPRRARRGTERENPDASVGVTTRETPTPVSQYPDAGVGRSQRERTDDLKEERRLSASSSEAAPVNVRPARPACDCVKVLQEVLAQEEGPVTLSGEPPRRSPWALAGLRDGAILAANVPSAGCVRAVVPRRSSSIEGFGTTSSSAREAYADRGGELKWAKHWA